MTVGKGVQTGNRLNCSQVQILKPTAFYLMLGTVFKKKLMRNNSIVGRYSDIKLKIMGQKRIETIADIDTDTPEGRLLFSAVCKITTESQTDKTHDEVMNQLNEHADICMAENIITGEEMKPCEYCGKWSCDGNCA